MGSLFAELARQASTNARREVETYAREIPEFRFLDTDPRARGDTMEYSVWLRRRTIELSPGNSELTADDLRYIATIGEVRAAAGMSSDSRQRVLRVHTALMLRDIHEATESQRGGDVEELMQVMTWFAPQGDRGIVAYRQGFVTVLRRRLPYVEQVALLARSLLTGDPMATDLAPALGLDVPEFCAVTVIRVPDRPAGDRDLDNEIEALVKTHRVPVVWCPEGGTRGGELIAVTPCADDELRQSPRPRLISYVTSPRPSAAPAPPAPPPHPGPNSPTPSTGPGGSARRPRCDRHRPGCGPTPCRTSSSNSPSRTCRSSTPGSTQWPSASPPAPISSSPSTRTTATT